jgi:hypothetical protein
LDAFAYKSCSFVNGIKCEASGEGVFLAAVRLLFLDSFVEDLLMAFLTVFGGVGVLISAGGGSSISSRNLKKTNVK